MLDDALNWIDEELAAWQRQGLLRQRIVRSGPQGAVIEVDGRQVVNFSSNDYLALAAEVSATGVTEALSAFGWGSGASPLITGRGPLHERLERELARFEGTEAALLFGSGYAANVGTIPALAGDGDVIFSDAKNHASIIDGCRLSGATVRIYRHADVADLAVQLGSAQGFRRRLIVTDGLFSMDGDLAPLADIAELARTHAAMLMVDEAHATGVFGSRGRGVSEQLGVEQSVDIRVGTLSKGLGSIGGFVVGSRRLIDWLFNRARSYVYSTAPPEAACAAGLAAIDLVERQPERRLRLLERAERLRETLQANGWDTGRSQSQIVPVIVGSPDRTMRYASSLREAGFFVPGIRPPSVPRGQSLLRISLITTHEDAAIEQLVEALEYIKGVRTH